jgi:hypothetical protein
VAITPKNWREFQHYKDRSPPWIKLHRGLLDNYEFHCLPDASKALAPLLWLLASEYTDGQITLSTAALAFRFRTTEKKINDALKPLVDAGFFDVDSAALAPRKQDACLEGEGETQEKAESCALEFEEFWKAYPKREGSNRKSPALKIFRSAVKRGTTPAEIIIGAKKFAEREATNVGTRFIPMATTWLNDRGWEEFKPDPADEERRRQLYANMEAKGWRMIDGKWVAPEQAA